MCQKKVAVHPGCRHEDEEGTPTQTVFCTDMQGGNPEQCNGTRLIPVLRDGVSRYCHQCNEDMRAYRKCVGDTQDGTDDFNTETVGNNTWALYRDACNWSYNPVEFYLMIKLRDLRQELMEFRHTWADQAKDENGREIPTPRYKRFMERRTTNYREFLDWLRGKMKEMDDPNRAEGHKIKNTRVLNHMIRFMLSQLESENLDKIEDDMREKLLQMTFIPIIYEWPEYFGDPKANPINNMGYGYARDKFGKYWDEAAEKLGCNLLKMDEVENAVKHFQY
ncbi:hypothetical protein F5Y16DRAFT_401994 [Xylariaceae sp. FL0255]|nr:hypothetical protein F5Y16DRAFT_401994 [Xylariaceae sp. FL0255]